METRIPEVISEEKILITRRDLDIAYTRWWWTHETVRSFERGLGPAFFYGIWPLLKKIYKDDEEELRDASNRALSFFNGQFSWCGTILGITASLEEVKEKQKREEGESQITNDMIESTKVGLFGPLAGIGDSITNGTIQYIIISLFLPLAMEGNWLGVVLPVIIFKVYSFMEGIFFNRMGYRLGRNAAKELIGGTKMTTAIMFLSILGTFMTGIIGSTFVKVTSALEFTISGNSWSLQTILDGILPGILPLAVIMSIYFYFEKKGLKPLNAIIYCSLILGVLAAIGVL